MPDWISMIGFWLFVVGFIVAWVLATSTIASWIVMIKVKEFFGRVFKWKKK